MAEAGPGQGTGQVKKSGTVELPLEPWSALVGLAQIGDEPVDVGGVSVPAASLRIVTSRRAAIR